MPMISACVWQAIGNRLASDAQVIGKRCASDRHAIGMRSACLFSGFHHDFSSWRPWAIGASASR
jgi:hypothetical protein